MIINQSAEEKIRRIMRKLGLARIMLWEDMLPSLLDKGNQTILDLGCGKGDPMSWINRKRKFKLRVGMDLIRENLKVAMGRNTHDCYALGDIQSLPFREKSFDACIVLGVISYLAKMSAREVLKEVERLSLRQVIVFTPNGQLFVQPEKPELFKTQVEGQKVWSPWGHKSSWTIPEFRERGYEVKGVNGLRWLRDGYGKIRFSGITRLLAALVSYSTQLILFFYPRFAFEIACIKSMNKEEITPYQK